MSSPAGHYDQSLLAAAPVATKAQLQEGYTTDLLNSGHATPPPSAPQSDPERGLVNKEYPGTTNTKALPFWRTKKGIIVIVVVVVVVLAAVIGGAVGGTAGKKKTPLGQEGEGGTPGVTSTGIPSGGTPGEGTKPGNTTNPTQTPSSTSTQSPSPTSTAGSQGIGSSGNNGGIASPPSIQGELVVGLLSDAE